MGASPTPGAVPVPDSGTDCGLPVASSVMVTAADLAPANVGEKVTLMVQLVLTARVAAQVCVTANCTVSVPVIKILAIFRTAVPVLVSVIDCEVLLVPMV